MKSVQQILTRVFEKTGVIGESPLLSRERLSVRGSHGSPSPHSSPVKGGEVDTATVSTGTASILAALLLLSASFACAASADELTAQDSIYRMPLNIAGIRPAEGTPKLAAQR
jgi:hypothetical protein